MSKKKEQEKSPQLNVLIAPVEMLVDALNSNINLQRYKILFISGNYSRILSRLDRNFTEQETRRADTPSSLFITILERTTIVMDI